MGTIELMGINYDQCIALRIYGYWNSILWKNANVQKNRAQLTES